MRSLAICASHPIQYQAPLFRELAKGLDVTVFFAHRATPDDQSRAGFGVEFDWDVDLLSGYPHQFLGNAARDPGLHHFAGCDTPQIREEFARRRFDGLMVMGWHLKCFWQAVWAAKRSGVPVMVRGDSKLGTPRTVFKRAAKILAYPLALRAFDVGLYVGQESRRYWEHYLYPRRRLVFSPHCIDTDWFAEHATQAAGSALRAEHGIGPDEKVVLFAGRLVPLKRPLDLVAAAGRLKEQGRPLTLLVAGSGPLGEAMGAAADHEGVKIVQLGFCNQTQMPAVYAAADMLVLPSNGAETWGLVANEALAAGCPVIVSSACGCAPDLVGDGEAGRWFEAGDIAALAERIASLMDRPPSKTVIAKRAGRYSVALAAAGVHEALDLVAARGGRA
ncbi:MAG: glycosyltransferase family 4 protein [Caulobacteraceae bacterium]|nr:glycosyltransferase family 4 protein [Caulobacteraceae bacterium]